MQIRKNSHNLEIGIQIFTFVYGRMHLEKVIWASGRRKNKNLDADVGKFLGTFEATYDKRIKNTKVQELKTFL